MKNTNTIFDLVEDEIPEGKEGFFHIAERAPEPKDNSFINDVADYAKTFLKGTVEGISRLGKVMGPTYDLPSTSEGKVNLGKSGEQELEQQTENLDELLPTDEQFTQKALRRGLRQAPTALAFPGSSLSTLPKAIAAGFSGEGAKKLGLPEWAQAAAELTTYIGPDLTKKLLSQGKNKEIIEFAKKMGMNEEQITPLIQSEFKQKWLSKLTPKGGGTQEILKNTKSALDETYGTLQKSEIASKEISEKANGKLINGIYEFIQEMPSESKSLIENDLNELLNNKITGRSLINFHKDINSLMSGKTKELSLLKKPIKEALSSISPDLAKDFDMLNNLYSKYFPIASKLKPDIASKIISASKTIGAMGALAGTAFGHYQPLMVIVGEQAASHLAKNMLVNPRLQQLSKKMVVAMNQNKYQMVKKLAEAFSDQIRKTSPEVAKELDKLTEEEIIHLLKSKQQ